MDGLERNEHNERKNNREKNEIWSKSIRAGKRTYFFDLKTSRKNEPYLTITESKRRFNEADGTFFYEKHKIFLLKEDLDDFYSELGKVIEFIEENPQLVNSEQNEDSDFSFDNDELE